MVLKNTKKFVLKILVLKKYKNIVLKILVFKNTKINFLPQFFTPIFSQNFFF